MMLPIDQGLEHGPVDFFDNPDAIDTDWIYRLAVAGNFSGIALHIGLAEKYQKKYAGRVPLLLKVNGKTNIPPDDDAFSPMTSSVEDAIGWEPMPSDTRSTSAALRKISTSRSATTCAANATATGCRWSSGHIRAARR